MQETRESPRFTTALLLWVGVKLFLLILLLDGTETIVLYQNY